MNIKIKKNVIRNKKKHEKYIQTRENIMNEKSKIRNENFENLLEKKQRKSSQKKTFVYNESARKIRYK